MCPSSTLPAGWFLVCVIAAALAQPAGVAAQGPAAQPVEVRHSFRDANLDDRLFRLLGPEAISRVKPEPEGVRMTLAAEQEKANRIGLGTAFGIQGDFTITAGYQLLHADRPKGSYGVGFLLYLVADTPIESGLAFFRVKRAKQDAAYVCSLRTVNEAGKRESEDKVFPATAESGKLRVTRTGSEVIVSAADGDGSDFRELRRYEFGRGDLKRVEVTAYPGQAPHAVDLRVTELDIRAESLPGLPPGAVAPPVPPPPGSRIGIVLGGMLLFGLAVAIAWYCTRRRRHAPASQVQETEAPISFRCSACAKAIKANLAGKAVRCPHCGHEVHVPIGDAHGSAPKAG